MHGFSSELNINGLIDSELQQICIGKFDLQFRFSSGTMISIQNDVRLLREGEVSASWTEDSGWDGVEFHNLLNVKVKSYEVLGEDSLRIEFQNGLILELTDSGRYESLQIYPFGDVTKLIVV